VTLHKAICGLTMVGTRMARMLPRAPRPARPSISSKTWTLVAAVLGGFNSLPLAVAGSLGVGVTFSLAQGYVKTPGFADLIVFGALLVILLVRQREQAALEVVAEF